MKLLFAFLLCVTCALTAHAQIGNCPRALGEAYLNANNVHARIVNTGGLFFRGEPHVYNVPKGTKSNAIFASGIWLGGMVDNTLRVSASRYGEWEMWGGPLDEAGNPPADCAAYDRIYKVSIPDILEYESTGFATPDLRDWPIELGAPVVDGDGIPDNYNLAAGDRPEIIGHQTLWWVMNDRGNIHESTDSPAIGLEVRVTAFAAQSENPVINNTTFYRYKLKYRGDTPWTEAYFGIFSDPDLGDFSDDYVGSDSTRNIGYVYNADNEDISNQGYGTPPPAVGYQFLKGAPATADGVDNNSDGIIDEPGEHHGMTAFVFYNGGGGTNEDPGSGIHYYLYMQGRWKDGRSILYGGDGFETGTTNTPTRFMYSGNPESGEGWSEVNPGADGSLPPNDPADRRFVLATGPFDMQPDEEVEITFAVVFALGENNLNSVTALKNTADEVQALYESNGLDVPLPLPPSQMVRLLSPAHTVSGQPTNPILYWEQPNSPGLYDIQWSTDPAFTEAQDTLDYRGTNLPLYNLMSETKYYWRIRTGNAAGFSPWSNTWQFTTANFETQSSHSYIQGFMAVQNAAGLIEPPDMAAFAFNSSSFPILEGNLTPSGTYPDSDRPTRKVQQANSDNVWGIHTGGATINNFGTNCLADCEDTFIGRSITTGWEALGMDDYEWRFPQACLDGINGVVEASDCLAFRVEDQQIIEVPFEIWNIGELINPLDDFQMIPSLCEESCEAGRDSLVFDIGDDHIISGNEDDPYTDWVSWHNPADNGATPGSQGYRDYFFNAATLGDKVFTDLVLVLWNGGAEPPYTAELPEAGTIMRIVTNPPESPVQSAPLNSNTELTQPISLYWTNMRASYQVQVATTGAFDTPLIDETDLQQPFLKLPVLERNQTYYWRTRLANTTAGGAASDWSPTWQFSVSGQVVSTESDAPLPTDFALEANYPNPFNTSTTIRYALPREAEVILEVYDLLGRRVRVITSAHQPAGWHEARFDASGLTSGVYFYRLSAEGFTQTRSMILLN